MVLFCSLFLLISTTHSASILDKIWILNLDTRSGEELSWPVVSASIFVFVALLVSICLIFEHLSAYNQPEEQKFLIGILLMVPVYALESFLSLLDPTSAFKCEIIRDCYEAFALYCFWRYLIACLGGEKEAIVFMEGYRKMDYIVPLLNDEYAYGVVEHPFPIKCCFNGWDLGSDFYHSVKIGIVQYMILKLLCALIAIVLEAFGVYGEGKFEWKYGYPYLAVILNFSQTWALYCLVLPLHFFFIWAYLKGQ